MKKFILFMVFLTAVSMAGYSQTLSVAEGIPSGIHIVENPTYGFDYLVNAFEPAGEMTGAQRSNNDWYLAVNDTSTTTNLGIIVFRSSNFGFTWTRLTSGIQPKFIAPNMRMVSAGNDSLYLFFLFGTDAYRWNIVNNSLGRVTADSLIRSFDVVASSTHSLYFYCDRNFNTNVRRYGSTDGGFTWINPGSVSSAAVYPKLYMSGSGDTLVLNYYGPVLADTMTSNIRAFRYRESAPGTLSSLGVQDVVTEPGTKSEFASVYYQGVVWFIYTLGTTGNIDIKCRVSTNSGANYNAAVNLAANPNVDEYWFSARHYNNGLDVNYYSDSLQSGAPTNNTDKIVNKYAFLTTPETFNTVMNISQHPPLWSPANYRPVTMEDYSSAAHYGVFWVGLDGTARKIYFDGDVVTHINNNGNITADNYQLSQNYPNPFNPTTKIDFSIPKSGFVTIKIYDILGKEVRSLVSQNMNAGAYTVNFDASKLSSGTYFYRLDVNGFSDVKKMTILK
jgi:hypothetical protein